MMNHRRGSTAGVFVTDHRHGSMTFFGENDDLVRLVVLVPRRRRPPRGCCRTRFGPCPIPFISDVEPALIIRDVSVLIKDIAVFRDDDIFRAGHDDCAGRGRDDLLRRGDNDRLFHDDRLLDDRRCRFHDDRSRTRLDDCANQVHDVGRQPDAVCRGLMVIPREGCGRSEDDRCSENSADGEDLVDGLLSSVSLWKRVAGFQSESLLFLIS